MAEGWASREFAAARVGDKRHRSTLTRIAESLLDRCGCSYSVACGHDGRQAGRRVFRSSKSSIDGLLAGHYAQTAARCQEHALVLAVQDTTVLDFSTHHATRGLGPTANAPHAQGLIAHSVLALSAEGLPLGLLDLSIWARDPDQYGRGEKRRKFPTDQKESSKWTRGLRAVRSALSSEQKVLLVQDREADVFDLFAEPRRAHLHLLVRACHPRRVEMQSAQENGPAETTDLVSAALSAPSVGTMSVVVPRSPGQPERETTLCVRARPVRILPPQNPATARKKAPQALWLISATEEDPPSGKEPIQWILITSWPLQEGEDAAQMVRYYALRWSIERLHYILKSGCRAERLQIDEAEALKNALALYYVVAWRIHWLTHIARTEPARPVDSLLATDEVAVLEAACKSPIQTVSDALLSIARLGGYVPYKQARPPGAKTIWEGIRMLEAMVSGWQLARSSIQNANQD